MKARIAALAVLTIIPAAIAKEKGENWEAKKQEQFSRFKEIRLQALGEKSAIIRDATSCIQSAQNHEAMKTRDDRERAAMETHKRKMKERWEFMKPKGDPGK